MLPKNHIILFTRFPVPGKTKTRLIPSLGPQKAADLQRLMTEKVVKEALLAAEEFAATVSVFYTNGTAEQMTEWLGDSCGYYPQSAGDIGLRMKDAFSIILKEPTRSVVLIGSDIPDVNAEIIKKALRSLRSSDTVLGPTYDGGYYLVGVNRDVFKNLGNSLFSEIPWSTDQVLEKTVQRINKTGCSYTLLQTLHDIDRPEDLTLIDNVDLT